MSEVIIPFRLEDAPPNIQFKRSYELYIGKPVTFKKIYGPSDTVLIDNYININNAKKLEPNTFLITENHITFSCKKDVKTSANKAKVSIFNPEDKVLEYIENFSTLKISFLFKAGYNGDNKEIFRGTIEDFEYDTTKPDKVLKLVIADSSNNLAEAQSNRYYPAGTSYAKIIRDLSYDLGLPLGVPITQKGSSKKPLYFTGKASVNIKFLAKLFNADFSIQDGAAWYLPENARLKEEVFKITQDTGLLFDVSAYSEKSGTTANDSEGISKKIKLKCLLNGSLLPNKTIYVESADGKYKGYYKIVELEHKGSYESTSLWCSDIVAKDVGNNTL